MYKKILFSVLAIISSFFVFKYFNFNLYFGLPKVNNFLDIFFGVSDILVLIYFFREILPKIFKLNWFWILLITFLIQAIFGGISVFGFLLLVRVLAWIWLLINHQFSTQFVIVLVFYGLFDHLLLTSSIPILFIFWLLTFGKIKFLDKSVQIVLIINIILAIYQILAQKSLGMQIFGESILSEGIFGIAKQEFGSLRIIKGYGLFQHPNILGSVGVLLLFWRDLKVNYRIIGLFLAILSMSRLAYFAMVFWFFTKIKNSFLKWFLVVSFAIFMSFWFVLRVPADMGRWIDLQNFLKLIAGFDPLQWLFGTMDYPKAISKLTNENWQWQPVHNVFLLLLAEFGLVGISACYFAIFNKKKNDLDKHHF